MEMTGFETLPVSQNIAWEALNDPALLQQSIAGCEKIERVTEHEFLTVVVASVGPVRATFRAKLTMEQVQAPHSYTLRFDGQGGIAGFGTGQAEVRLSAIDPQHTRLDYSVKAQVGGKLAQIGSRLIDATAQKMAGDFFARFNEVLQERYPSAHSPSVPSTGGVSPAEGGESSDASSATILAIAVGMVAVLYFIAWGLKTLPAG